MTLEILIQNGSNISYNANAKNTAIESLTYGYKFMFDIVIK